MKKLQYIASALLACCAFAGCTEAEKTMFDAPDAISFRMPAADADKKLIIRDDTIVYTFAYDPVETREICIPLEVVGFAAQKERKYRIEVKNIGTMTPGTDYVALDPVQTFPAGKMYDSLRVVFNRTPSMASQVKKIEINITDGGDFVMGPRENLFVAIQVSDILEEPTWWNHWKGGFGTWHPTKLREWIRIWGGTGELRTDRSPSWYYHPKELTALLQLKKVFQDNVFYDFDGTTRLTIPANY